METGIELVRLILSGAFERYPRLNIIVGHWGEFVPIFLSRLDYMLSKEKTGLRKNISEYYREHVYVSPSGIYSDSELKYCLEIMGAEHILFSADYPFIEYGNVGEYLANAPVCDVEKEKIGYRNAERLLRL